MEKDAMRKKKKVVIVGAGPGGLAAGMLLAHRGMDVEIFEKEAIPGGRNGSLKLGKYTFDIGPTFFMMDFVLRDIFKKTGRNLDDYAKLSRLSPMYRLHFNDKTIDIHDEEKLMRKELARVFPGEESGLKLFEKLEKKRFEKLYPILSRHNNTIWDAFKPNFLSALPSFAIGRSIFTVLGRYFKQGNARLCFTFQAKYLGMSPWECPGAFAMVPFVEHQYGIYHVQGGLNALAGAMAKVVGEEGGSVRYGKTVREIIVEKGAAKGIVLENGEKVLADKVIVNADFAYAMNNLVKEGTLKKYSRKRLAKKQYSCSIFMLYLGVKKKYDLPHHSIVFAHDYKKNVGDIFDGRLTKRDFSFYVQNAGYSDPTLAPRGKSTLYVLVPVPNNKSDIDWKKNAPIIRERVLELMEERLGLGDIREHIEVEKIITPERWEYDFNVQYGAVFNLGHQLRQMLWFRPHNRFEEIENVFLVGGGTHPGSGLPTIYESGRIAADLIFEEGSKE